MSITTVSTNILVVPPAGKELYTYILTYLVPEVRVYVIGLVFWCKMKLASICRWKVASIQHLLNNLRCNRNIILSDVND